METELLSLGRLSCKNLFPKTEEKKKSSMRSRTTFKSLQFVRLSSGVDTLSNITRVERDSFRNVQTPRGNNERDETVLPTSLKRYPLSSRNQLRGEGMAQWLGAPSAHADLSVALVSGDLASSGSCMYGAHKLM